MKNLNQKTWRNNMNSVSTKRFSQFTVFLAHGPGSTLKKPQYHAFLSRPSKNGILPTVKFIRLASEEDHPSLKDHVLIFDPDSSLETWWLTSDAWRKRRKGWEEE